MKKPRRQNTHGRSIAGTSNFEGSLGKLQRIIDDAVQLYGKDTICKFDVFGSFPHRCHIIVSQEITDKDEGKDIHIFTYPWLLDMIHKK